MMRDEETLRIELLKLIAEAGFADRYYAFCDTHPLDFSATMPKREVVERGLLARSMPTRYYPSENLHVYAETDHRFTSTLRIAIGRHSLEMILAVTCEHGGIGETYHGLAYDVARLLNPAFERSPPYPKMHLSKAGGLEQALDFGVSLFRRAQGAVLSYEGWDALFGKEPP